MAIRNKSLLVVWALCAGAVAATWIGTGAAFLLDAPKAVFVGGVIAAALATEGFVWLTAAVLGLSAFANRHWLLGRVFGRGETPAR